MGRKRIRLRLTERHGVCQTQPQADSMSNTLRFGAKPPEADGEARRAPNPASGGFDVKHTEVRGQTA